MNGNALDHPGLRRGHAPPGPRSATIRAGAGRVACADKREQAAAQFALEAIHDRQDGDQGGNAEADASK